MSIVENASELYRKYLIEIVFEKQGFFTVSGEDTTDGDNDKLLVDSEKKLLLFSTIESVFAAIPENKHFFDHTILKDWANELPDHPEVYATISFDALVANDNHLSKTEWMGEIYTTIGIVRDYAEQVEDLRLQALLEEERINEFYEIVSDYVLWGAGEIPLLTYDLEEITPLFEDIYTYLNNEKIAIY